MLPANFRFADPWVLAALAALPVLLLLYLRARPYRLRSGVVLSTLSPLAQVRPGWRVRLRPALGLLRLLALGLLVVGLARPQTVDASAKFSSEGIDIVLAFDISGSMRDAGLDAPTKIEAAKRALKEFLDSRKDDRVGLVVFRSEARVMSPLSTDFKALSQQVDGADRNQNLEEGTGIGVGLSTALNVLRDSHARSRVVILATDGENNVSKIEPEVAGKIAEQLKIRVYTIGIPTSGARPEQSLNERQMRTIAEGTGGSYTRAANEQGLAEIFDKIATLEKTQIERERFTRYNELAPWALIPAFALVVLEALLGATLFRRAP